MEKTGPSSTRKCSEEELQKAIADLKEVVSRHPIPDDDEEANIETEEEKEKEKAKDEKKKKKKTKLHRLRPEEVQMLLRYECSPFPEFKSLAVQEKEDKEKCRDKRTMVTVAEVFYRHYRDGIAATLEEIRHELRTKGYVTYEATDDEAEEEEEESAAHRGARGGGGRRRHRPGVTKHAGVVKKLN